VHQFRAHLQIFLDAVIRAGFAISGTWPIRTEREARAPAAPRRRGAQPRAVSAVLVAAIRDGLSLLLWHEESFAYTDSFDEATGRYRGLRTGQAVALSAEQLSGHGGLCRSCKRAKTGNAEDRGEPSGPSASYSRHHAPPSGGKGESCPLRVLLCGSGCTGMLAGGGEGVNRQHAYPARLKSGPGAHDAPQLSVRPLDRSQFDLGGWSRERRA
jgi:hypothetical protein